MRQSLQVVMVVLLCLPLISRLASADPLTPAQVDAFFSDPNHSAWDFNGFRNNTHFDTSAEGELLALLQVHVPTLEILNDAIAKGADPSLPHYRGADVPAGDSAMRTSSVPALHAELAAESYWAYSSQASRDASFAIVMSLLNDYGMDPNQQAQDDSNRTPLMMIDGFLLQQNEVRFMDALVFAGADINSRDSHERTPLMYYSGLSRDGFEFAGRGHSAAFVEEALEQGAFPNLRDEDGNTALMYAAAVCDPDAIKALLDHCARKKIRNNADQSALDLVGKWVPYGTSTSDCLNSQRLIEASSDEN